MSCSPQPWNSSQQKEIEEEFGFSCFPPCLWDLWRAAQSWIQALPLTLAKMEVWAHASPWKLDPTAAGKGMLGCPDVNIRDVDSTSQHPAWSHQRYRQDAPSDFFKTDSPWAPWTLVIEALGLNEWKGYAARIFLTNLGVFFLMIQRVIPSCDASHLGFSEIVVVCWRHYSSPWELIAECLSPTCAQWPHAGRLKSAMLRVFTPQKSAKAASQGSPPPKLVVKCLSAQTGSYPHSWHPLSLS